MCWLYERGAGSSSRREERGSQGAPSLPSTLPTSPALGTGKEGEVAGRGGVTARALLLTQAGIGAGLAVVTPGPLSPRFFHKHVLFWVEEIRGNGGEGVCVRNLRLIRQVL